MQSVARKQFWYSLCLLALIAAVCVALVRLGKSTVYTNRRHTYAVTVPAGWAPRPVPNGLAFGAHGHYPATVLVMDDPLLTPKMLFSAQTEENIRMNYEETYNIDEEDVTFSRAVVAGHDALVVDFVDKSDKPLLPKRQYYMVRGTDVYLITIYRGNSDARRFTDTFSFF